MSRVKWCPNCRANVFPYKRFSVLAFVFSLFVPYLLHFFLLKRKGCPFCEGRRFSRRRVIVPKRAK